MLFILTFYHSLPLKNAIYSAWCTNAVCDALYSPYSLCSPAISFPNGGDTTFKTNPDSKYQAITTMGPDHPII